MRSFFRSFTSESQSLNLQQGPTNWARDAPSKQPYFTFSSKGKNWVSSEGSSTTQTQAESEDEGLVASPSTVTILTWNIDFMRPFPKERMSAALFFLETYLSTSIPTTNAVVILLQEMTVSDLHLIESAHWIRERFHITDQSLKNWASGHYGTCTLIDKRLHLIDVFRVHYQATNMGRDALFVDITFPATVSKEEQDSLTSTMPDPQTLALAQHESSKKTIRVCNTHLESLRAVPPLRPLQLITASRFMLQPDMHASILGGDLNAIEPFDRTLHADHGLKDAYLELGGKEDSEEGYTWGQMAGRAERERYGSCRMDKVIFAGGVVVKRLERVGSWVEIEGVKEREMLRGRAGLDGGWVTDHVGLRADFEVTE